MSLPTLGSRIHLGEHYGTIRYVGQVDSTTGVWLGIEWDDPSRGRHDGVKDNKRYFSCRNPKAGSFVRPSASISYGRSFLEALSSKYIETLHGHESAETVVLGSSQGAIIVEAVRLDKIRGKLADLTRLREVSLDREDVARCDPPGKIQDTCPNIRGLDLSTSLVPSWDIIALIAGELPALQRLVLNRNRLQPPTDLDVMRTAFPNLTELLLNGTNMTWPEMEAVAALMPTLCVIELGYNSLTHLKSQHANQPQANITIHVINLDSNYLSDWINIWMSLQQYRAIQHLILTSNRVEAIPFPANPIQRLDFLKHVSLSHNKINSWNDIDALSSWCPALETLTLIGNPVTNRDPQRHVRPFIISKIPSLLTLDGVTISPRERNDSELFYQSYVVQQGLETEEERRQAHPQWARLCVKHGTPENSIKECVVDKLSNRLISLNFLDSHISTDEKTQDHSVPFVLRVLPSMTLRTLRMKLSKALKRRKATILLSARQIDGSLRELHTNDDTQDLSRLGIDDGSIIVFHIVET